MALKCSELGFFANWLTINVAKAMLTRVLTIEYIIKPTLAAYFNFSNLNAGLFDGNIVISCKNTLTIFAFNMPWQSNNFLIYQS